jgi:hypothetical protein
MKYDTPATGRPTSRHANFIAGENGNLNRIGEPAVLQFACPYCNGMFQVDPSLAGGEAMCPICRGVIVVPADAFGPPVSEEPAPPETNDFDFTGRKRGGMFAGLDDGPSSGGDSAPAAGGRFAHLLESPPHDAPPEASSLLAMGCPHCGSPFQVDGSLAGQQAMCPACRGVVVIPDFNATEPGYAPSYPPSPADSGPLPSPPEIRPTSMPSYSPPGSVPTQPSAQTPHDRTPEAAPPAPVSLRPPSADVSPSSTLLPPPSAQPLAPKSDTSSDTSTVGDGLPGDKPTAKQPPSRSAKIDAMLPAVADPDEEVVAERPIAVEQPPEEAFPPLVTDMEANAPLADADGRPIRRLTSAERARIRRVRTMLLFAVGMLVLVLAAVLLPRMGFMFDVGKMSR